MNEHASELDEDGVLGLEVGLGQRVGQQLVGEGLHDVLLRLEELGLEALIVLRRERKRGVLVLDLVAGLVLVWEREHHKTGKRCRTSDRKY